MFDFKSFLSKCCISKIYLENLSEENRDFKEINGQPTVATPRLLLLSFPTFATQTVATPTIAT